MKREYTGHSLTSMSERVSGKSNFKKAIFEKFYAKNIRKRSKDHKKDCGYTKTLILDDYAIVVCKSWRTNTVTEKKLRSCGLENYFCHLQKKKITLGLKQLMCH